ncbi:MAG TPA: T9SS type A sorting domain-containing protein [Bacteroidia bacterium]|nr:T9SS type A sorting domain-containing protein [Bacteroidia bacterium]
MKKLFTLINLLLFSLWSNAQNDTLLYENFDADPTGNANWTPIPAFPSNTVNDTMWYNYDADALPDQSGQSRPGEWWWSSGGFADTDNLDGCMFSNSWTLDPNPVKNYLITPSIQIIDATAIVSWASAPRQTPRYLDGYVVVVSTSTNDENNFTDTLFVAGENQDWVNFPNDPPDSSFSSYFFQPTGPNVFIHGLDGNYVEYHGDSIRLIGQQRPFSASLAAYSGQSIYIAFVHYTVDDNLISLDDILVVRDSTVGVNEISNDAMKMYSYPNPAKKNIRLNFTMNKTSDVTIHVSDVLGNQILNNKLKNVSGKYSYSMNVEKLSAGTYYYTVTSDHGRSTNKFVILK